MAISTNALLQLPSIPALKALSQSLAVLDAILSPDWENRYHSFNAHWAASKRLLPCVMVKVTAIWLGLTLKV
jgi:hypothetical protein